MTTTAAAGRPRAHPAAPVEPAAPRTRFHTDGRPGSGEQTRLAVTLGAVLRMQRARVGVSQHRLATLAGCHVRTVERLEVGRLRPTPAMLAALAHALVVPPGYTPAMFTADVEALRATLAAAAGESLVPSTPGGQRRRRRRLRRARLAANRAAVPVLRALVARRSMPGNILTVAEADALRRAAWGCRP